MKNGFFFLALSCLLVSVSNANELKAINFKQKGEVSRLELLFDKKNVQASKFQIKEDRQIIIDLKNVSSTDRVVRAFDTSEFSGAVVLMSAYKKPGNDKDLRIAIQLRDNVRSVLRRNGKAIIVDIENRFGVFDQRTAELGQSKPDELVKTEDTFEELLVPKSDSIDDILENLTLSGPKKYIGKRISINVKAVGLADVLRMIANVSGFNIIVTEDVKKAPPLTLSLTNIPWDQALDTILELSELAVKKNGKILVVQSREQIFNERLALKLKEKKVEKEESLVTKIFPISFASPSELQNTVKNYLTERGKISTNKRTSSLIVRDTQKTMEKVLKIIDVLDTQTPQVLIESKIVEISESYSKEIGIGTGGLEFGYDPINAPAQSASPGFSFSTAPISTKSKARSLFALNLSQLGKLNNLNFTLQLLETESKAKIVASPRVITQNNVQASISSTNKQSSLVSDGVDSSGKPVSKVVDTQGKLSLQVTPQVTNDGSISLKISLQKDEIIAPSNPSSLPSTQSRQLSTEVLVDNGSTVVLGGIYRQSESNAISGVPLLKDVPIIGWLFRTPYTPKLDKSEMIIFMTPRIINQEEAGLTDRS